MRVALALQADGWWLRSDIVWAKRNPMPESVSDRPTRSHEYVFLLTKSERYFYDADAIREPHKPDSQPPDHVKKHYQGVPPVGLASAPEPALGMSNAGPSCGALLKQHDPRERSAMPQEGSQRLFRCRNPALS